MTFSPFTDIPRHHPIRRAAAQRIRAMRRLRPPTLFDMRRWKRQRSQTAEARRRERAKSVWGQRYAVGCVDTGDLFMNISHAVKFFGLHWDQIRRSAGQGRAVGRRQLTFVWLDVRMRRAAGAKRSAGRGLAVAA